MTRDLIVSKVKQLNLPGGSYVVFGSGPLTAVGLREANDIDLYVSKEVFEDLKAKGWEVRVKSPNDKPLVSDLFEAHESWDFSPDNPPLKDLLARSFVIDGVRFASLEDVRKWKVASGRPKDLNDIKLIDGYMKNGN